MNMKQIQPRRMCWKKIFKKLHSIVSRIRILRFLQHLYRPEGMCNLRKFLHCCAHQHPSNESNSVSALLGYRLNICYRIKNREDVPFPPSVPPPVFSNQDSVNLHQSLINIWKQLKKMKSPSLSEKGLQSVASNHLLRIVKEFRRLIMPGHLPV